MLSPLPVGEPIFKYGTPYTLLTLSKLPIENGTTAVLTFLVVLGFGTSTIVDPTRSISNPLTYAVPAETLTHIKSSLGSFPCSVFWPSL